MCSPNEGYLDSWPCFCIVRVLIALNFPSCINNKINKDICIYSDIHLEGVNASTTIVLTLFNTLDYGFSLCKYLKCFARWRHVKQTSHPTPTPLYFFSATQPQIMWIGVFRHKLSRHVWWQRAVTSKDYDRHLTPYLPERWVHSLKSLGKMFKLHACPLVLRF